ncbi:MAG: MBL fold metallo-hydrolase [Candidatus Omnitrophica bacterium]|nr:MBL fold metallo-hydrolase [Candidatus Omnitrophota bacterium]
MSISKELIFEQILAGPMGNFVYLIGDAQTKEVLVVDVGWEVDKLVKKIQERDYKVAGLMLTHAHFDHTGGVKNFLRVFNVNVYIAEPETDFFMIPVDHLVMLNDGDKIKVGSLEIDCILTPGHSPGCMCFRYKNILITGDTLFVDAIGRTDLPGSDPKAMDESLAKLLKLPDDTVIYPGHAYGHADCDTIGNQRKTNPYF